MKLKKEWYTTPELVGLVGMPKTIGGINYKAKNENWERRKPDGMKGRAFEYHIDSLPKEVQQALQGEIERQPSLPSEMASIPYYDIHASAGHGAVVGMENMPALINIRPDYLTNQGISPKNLFAIPVAGDSMEPTLYEDDIAIVHRKESLPRVLEGIYVLRIGNQLFVKRIQYNNFEAFLKVGSDNTFYNSYTIHNEDLNEVEILGEVVLTLSKPRKRIAVPKERASLNG